MRSTYVRFRSLALRLMLAILAVLPLAAPASAQWSQVPDIVPTAVPAVWANGDTIAAGADSVVYVSTNAGATWHRSTKPAAGVSSIQAVYVQDGRVYAGTFGQGVHVSDDLGATWSPFNQGLVGGFLDSQLDVTDLMARSDTLYVATAGAGVYLRSLAGSSTWTPSAPVVFEENQSSNVNALALGGGRLLATAIGNGFVFVNDPGQVDWTLSNLDNIGPHAGLDSQTAVWTGTAWVVGTPSGIFHSTSGQEPWTRFNPAIGTVSWVALATHQGHLFAALDTPTAAVMEESDDDGATWQKVESQPNVFVQKMAVSGGHLYAARGDGLWRRPLTVTSVEDGGAPNALRFAIAGPQPFGSGTRLRFDLPRAGAVSIEVFDVHGRLVGNRVAGTWPAGHHEVSLNAERLASGVYMARLTAGGRQQVVRLVHVR